MVLVVRLKSSMYSKVIEIAVIVLQVAEGASWFEVRANSCGNFRNDASKCLDAFAQFATKKPGIKEACA